jgi:hypothetical protein
VPGLALVAGLIAAAAFAVPALAQEPADTSIQFTLGRLVHATPDARGRIAIRSACQEPSGCKVKYSVTRAGTQPPAFLGGLDFVLLPDTVETDYVTFAKKTTVLLARKRSLKITITADVRDNAGNSATFTKAATLKAAPKKRRR